ncbi:hypothetical protein SODALDRAFT_356795 [Sodiomyces alkalinus F11]|uniref:Uncharacterized protein n=1 Tax=Sodiomyces alkalinus (strain CBS 110278 / VKM F-3762 / F11) TaxID=1314773 RepID=A0A3N2Q220_SODAK|nr:hypothetical protein SODALDRAFT_356795 [Sodiomyces alkalinus F11]ROT40782.1 hypothetical protein SODALDRAFT_356795 [Sodiomyces alkalinus F11]
MASGIPATNNRCGHGPTYTDDVTPPSALKCGQCRTHFPAAPSHLEYPKALDHDHDHQPTSSFFLHHRISVSICGHHSRVTFKPRPGQNARRVAQHGRSMRVCPFKVDLLTPSD